MLSLSTYQPAPCRATVDRLPPGVCAGRAGARQRHARAPERYRVSQSTGANLGVADGGRRAVVLLDLRDPPWGWPFVRPPALRLDADLSRLRGLIHPQWQRARA